MVFAEIEGYLIESFEDILRAFVAAKNMIKYCIH